MTTEKNVKHVHVKFIVNTVKRCSSSTMLNVLKCSSIAAAMNNLIKIQIIIICHHDISAQEYKMAIQLLVDNRISKIKYIVKDAIQISYIL